MICTKHVFRKLYEITPLEKTKQKSEKMLKMILDKQNVGCEELWIPQQKGTS
jgi:hypothetical protein